MAVFADLNPQDTVFYAYSKALERLGLPGTLIQVHLELEGELDPDDLRRGLLAVYKAYPATNARLWCHPVTGRPRWRLDTPLPNFDRLIRVQRLDPPTMDTLLRATEDLLLEPIDVEFLPPLQFRVFRGLPKGDVLAIRWPHYFMDVRGITLWLEEIEKLYLDRADPATVRSVGDESRRDFEKLIGEGSTLQHLRTLAGMLGEGPPPDWRDAYLPNLPLSRPFGPIRHVVRFLTPEQTQAIQDASMRALGFARFGDFVRATAIRSLHRAMTRELRPNEGYSTSNVIDLRKRRDRAPVCHNLFHGLPMRIPAAMAEDRKAAAEEMRRQTEQIVAADGVKKHLTALKLFSQLSIATLSDSMYRNIAPEYESLLPIGMGTPPSILVGFSGASKTYIPSFCGRPRGMAWGLGMPPPISGFAIDLNMTGDRLHLSSTFYERRISPETMNGLVDDFVAGLLDAEV